MTSAIEFDADIDEYEEYPGVERGLIPVPVIDRLHPDRRLETLMMAIYPYRQALLRGDPDLDRYTQAALASLEALGPYDEAESKLAIQMVATHEAAMCCLGRAQTPGLAQGVRDRELKNADKFMALYVRPLQALNKHRGLGQPNITVERVKVETGPAIVGNVTANAGPGERQSAQQWPDAREPALRRQDPKRYAVSGACGAWQVAVPHAWGRQGIRRAAGQSKRPHARTIYLKCHRRASAFPGPAHGARDPTARLRGPALTIGAQARASAPSASTRSLPRLVFSRSKWAVRAATLMWRLRRAPEFEASLSGHEFTRQLRYRWPSHGSIVTVMPRTKARCEILHVRRSTGR